MFALVLFGTSTVARKLLPVSEAFASLPGLLAALAALVFAVILESRFSNVSLGQALRSLGFKSGKTNQYLIALAGTLPILGAYLIVIFLLGKSAAFETGALFLLLKLTISQGLIEEAVFRGLLFRHLRANNSFWTAATLSGILFALIHVVNLAKGVSPEILRSLGISIGFGFILTFPLAILFELGAGSLFAGAIFHLAIDSINCFKEVGEPGLPMNIYLASVLLSAIVVVALALMSKALTTD